MRETGSNRTLLWLAGLALAGGTSHALSSDADMTRAAALEHWAQAATEPIAALPTGWFVNGSLEATETQVSRDVAFLVFSGLVPHQRYTAEIALAEPCTQTRLAALDPAAGTVTATDAHSGEFQAGQLTWRADATGQLHLAVASRGDTTADGSGPGTLPGRFSLAIRPEFGQLSCPADLNGDGLLDLGDISRFVLGYNTADPTLDFTPDGLVDLADAQAFVDAFLVGCPDAIIDRDGDRLPDDFEARLGTSTSTDDANQDGVPDGWDTDGDFISDGDEVLGTLRALPLPTLGANPLRADLFVEHDELFYEGWNGFTPEILDPLLAMYDQGSYRAPQNSNGEFGVTMHFDQGQGYPNLGGNWLEDPPGDPSKPVLITFGEEKRNPAEFESRCDQEGYDQLVGTIAETYRLIDIHDLRAQHMAERRLGYFRYLLAAPFRLSPTCLLRTGGGRAGQISDLSVFILESEPDPDANPPFHPIRNAANIAHEFGHMLGLRHGGFEDDSFKPNYVSIMNFRYTTYGLDTTGNSVPDTVTALPGGLNVDWSRFTLDYSRGDLADAFLGHDLLGTLDENELHEAFGIGAIRNGQPVPIDWNADGDTDDIIQPGILQSLVDINQRIEFYECDGIASPFPVRWCPDASFNQGCPNPSPRAWNCSGLLRDFDDWSNLDFSGLRLSR